MLIFVFSTFPLLAADSEKKWTLAAEKFTLTQKNSSAAVESINSTLPALILEQLAENLKRIPRGREKLDRSLYELQKSRIDLFLQLSKEVKTRDSVLLNNYSPKKLKMKLNESEKKIQAIQKKIDENLIEVKKQNEKYALQIENMSKYEPLWNYLKENKKESYKITYEEIKNVLGFEIDHSFLSYKKELKDYGYEVGKISMKEKTVIFNKI